MPTQNVISSHIAILLASFDTDSESEIDIVLSHLNVSIEKIFREIIELPSASDEKISLYGPYLGRSLMELAATALLAKLDPLRMLIVKGKQTHSSYDMTKPQKSSIRWQGDVMSDPVKDLWADNSLNSPTRALFGAYNVELVLKKSAEKLIDTVTPESIGDWYDSIMKNDANTLIERMKSEISTLYSFLSKGIHHELVVPIESKFDRDTVSSRLNELIYNISTLGLIVAFVPHAYNKNSIENCMELYKSIQDFEVK